MITVTCGLAAITAGSLMMLVSQERLCMSAVEQGIGMMVGHGCDPEVGKRDEANLRRPPTNIKNDLVIKITKTGNALTRNYFLKFSSFMKQGAEAMLTATQRYIYLEYMSGYPFTHEA
jgi:hypothetical protein